MHHQPELPQFLELAKQHRLVPIYRHLIGDTLTPVTAFRKIQDGDWSFLFESVVGGERLGRYSFVGFGPFLRFQAFGHRVQIHEPAPGSETGSWSGRTLTEVEHPDPLKLLEEKLSAYRAPNLPGLPRFCGG